MSHTSLLFDKLLAETAKVMCISVADIPVSKGRVKRWSTLAEFWAANQDYFDTIFFCALYHIASCRYPRKTTPAKPLLTLVEKAMTSDGDALAAWRYDEDFRSSFTRVSEYITSSPYCWESNTMRTFIYNRLYCITFYRERPQLILTHKLILQERAFRALRKRVKIQSEHDLFVQAITTLIPAAHEWTADQWTDEKAIFAQIYAVHGVDYTENIGTFDKLITMLMHKLEGTPYYRTLFHIEEIPPSIAAIIWPQNMAKEICTQFNYVSRIKPFEQWSNHIVYNSITPEVVTKSWAFQQLSEWRESKQYNLSSAVRKNMLSFALGEYPRAS